MIDDPKEMNSFRLKASFLMSRDEMIALLVCDTLDRIIVMRQVFWLQDILENGFAGFTLWSDEDLRRELCGRGLDSVRSGDGAAIEDRDSELCDSQDDDEYLMLAGYVDCGNASLIHFSHDS